MPGPSSGARRLQQSQGTTKKDKPSKEEARRMIKAAERVADSKVKAVRSMLPKVYDQADSLARASGLVKEEENTPKNLIKAHKPKT
jgi:hypothetical protein